MSDVCIWLEIKTTVCIAFGPSVQNTALLSAAGERGPEWGSSVSGNKAHFHAKCTEIVRSLFFSKQKPTAQLFSCFLGPPEWEFFFFFFFLNTQSCEEQSETETFMGVGVLKLEFILFSEI